MNNQEILRKLITLHFSVCGTGKMKAIRAIGKEAYYTKEKERKLNLFNQLDKSTLPFDKLNELEELIKEEAELLIKGEWHKWEKRDKIDEIIEELLISC